MRVETYLLMLSGGKDFLGIKVWLEESPSFLSHIFPLYVFLISKNEKSMLLPLYVFNINLS